MKFLTVTCHQQPGRMMLLQTSSSFVDVFPICWPCVIASKGLCGGRLDPDSRGAATLSAPDGSFCLEEVSFLL